MFEKLKETMKRRIEEGTIKSYLDGEVVYLKKSKIPIIGGDWNQVHLPLNEDDSWNITNLLFGGWRNLIKLIIILVIVGMAMSQMINDMYIIKTLLDNPCVQNCIEISKSLS
ncbi:MAG: hypothetical protein ACOC3Z_02020 [Nanoarchaeota archaeon]